MAIKKTDKPKLGSYRFTIGENSLNLVPNLRNIEAFTTATGDDWLEFLFKETNGPAEMATFFYYMQYPEGDEEVESREDIYEAFFADLAVIMSPEYQDQLIRLIAGLMNTDYNLVIEELSKNDKPDQKKESTEAL